MWLIKRFVSLKQIFFFCLCIKMNTFALFTAEAWDKNDAEVIEYGGEIWINQKHLEKCWQNSILFFRI